MHEVYKVVRLVEGRFVSAVAPYPFRKTYTFSKTYDDVFAFSYLTAAEEFRRNVLGEDGRIFLCKAREVCRLDWALRWPVLITIDKKEHKSWVESAFKGLDYPTHFLTATPCGTVLCNGLRFVRFLS